MLHAGRHANQASVPAVLGQCVVEVVEKVAMPWWVGARQGYWDSCVGEK